MLLKWKWRALQKPNALWVHVIKSIHGVLLGADQPGSNGVWSKIIGSINYLHDRNIIHSHTMHPIIGNGNSIKFWKDCWFGHSPLKDRYSRIFRLDNHEDAHMADRLINNDWFWDWKRTPNGGRLAGMFDSFIQDIDHHKPIFSHVDDRWAWNLGKDGIFTVHEARRIIDDFYLPSDFDPTCWNKYIPRKINIFVWRLMINRLPNLVNLSNRGMDINSIACPVCNIGIETIDHIFFNCQVALNLWHLVRVWCKSLFPIFHSLDDWNSWLDSSGSSNINIKIQVIFSATCWITWRFRNNVVFQSHSMRKIELFDNIRFFSFYWLNSRSCFVSNRNDWFMNPL